MSSSEYLTTEEVEVAARRFRERLKAKDPSLMALLAKMRKKPPRRDSCFKKGEIFVEFVEVFVGPPESASLLYRHRLDLNESHNIF